MIRNIWIVAKYAFLEGLRARFYIGGVVLALLFMIVGSYVAAVPYGRVDHLVGSIGWGAILLTTLVVSIYYAVQITAQEREQRILHMMLGRPVRRGSYALGKYLGVLGLAGVMVLVEAAALILMLAIVGNAEHNYLREWLLPSFYVWLKLAAVIAMSLWFATMFVTPLVAIAAAGVWYLVGSASHEVAVWAQNSEHPFLLVLARVLEWMAPQFGAVDVEGWTVFGQAVQTSVYVHGAFYLIGYAAIGVALLVLTAEATELT